MADLVARIAALWRYPVKSCAGEAVEALTLGADGWPVDDRAWSVIDASNELTWMGAHPRLALVHARLTPGGVELRSPGQTLRVEQPRGAERSVRAWNGERQDFDVLQAWDAGEAAAALLQRATGARLIVPDMTLPWLPTEGALVETPWADLWLGGADWARTKGQARKAVKQIAADFKRVWKVNLVDRFEIDNPQGSTPDDQMQFPDPGGVLSSELAERAMLDRAR